MATASFYTLGLSVFGILSIYLHYKTCVTSPGYPECVSTAQGEQKIKYDKNSKVMSQNLKLLVSKRNQGFVGLLNSTNQNFTRYQNQCFKCNLKPLKPYRSYHCWTCDRDIIYRNQHCTFCNNCIGLYNLRYFLLFLLYATLGLSMMVYAFYKDSED